MSAAGPPQNERPVTRGWLDPYTGRQRQQLNRLRTERANTVASIREAVDMQTQPRL